MIALRLGCVVRCVFGYLVMTKNEEWSSIIAAVCEPDAEITYSRLQSDFARYKKVVNESTIHGFLLHRSSTSHKIDYDYNIIKSISTNYYIFVSILTSPVDSVLSLSWLQIIACDNMNTRRVTNFLAH
ncbi:unnamed protein product [Blumeria hordei]|uniref:Uncharacterized protein n=1 Tax=Blumeria hordei TaxID=2867405 RepID=A0A383UNQ6_BLUHO|nr:unnamed protein product [Blumeria hordei]